MTPIVVCFGQRAAGDDAVGLWVARQLVREGIPARESGDATQLLDWLAHDQPLIVVDAVVGAAESGKVLHLRPDSLASSGCSPVSCHGLGVAQVLELAQQLYGAAAGRVDIVAITIARPQRASEHLSETASRAVGDACRLVRRLLDPSSRDHSHGSE